MKAKYYLLLYILLAFSLTNLFANSENQNKAEKAYAEKKYKDAIKNYEAILNKGLSSYKLYYNLGNAYYKNNELGKAIYNYELAKKIQPNNIDIRNNLKIANEKTIDKIENKENYFIGTIKLGIVNLLSSNGWAWLSIISWIITLTLIFIFIFSKSLLIKRTTFFAGITCFLVFCVSIILGNLSLNEQNNIEFAIILNHESKIYEEPILGTKSKFKLHEGTKIKVLETNTEWTNIKLENGNEGWIKTNEIGLF